MWIFDKVLVLFWVSKMFIYVYYIFLQMCVAILFS